MFSGKLRLSDDEEDFCGDVESTRSNLSNIFGVSLAGTSQNEDHSLKYVPPKQAKPIEDLSEVDKTTTWNIQIAKVVTAFKLVNDENEAQGKVGLAVLRSRDDLYKIILYRTKSKVLSTFSIVENSRIFLKNSYFQFRDDFQTFWSILFDNGEERTVIDIIKDKVIIEEFKDDDTVVMNKDLAINKKHEEAVPEQQIPNEGKTENNSSDERLKESKAQILSRMAKMGKPLPKFSATTTDFSDSSDNEAKSRLPPKPIAVPRKPKAQQLLAVAPTNTQLAPAITTIATYTPNLVNAETQYLNTLLSENRTQNTEIRINISKLETKIERVLDKIDAIESKSSRSNGRSQDDEILELEEKLLVMKKENRILRAKIEQLEDENSKKPKCEGEISEFNHLAEMFNLNKDEYETSHDFLRELLRKCDSHCISLKSLIESNEQILEDCKTQIQTLELQKEQEISELKKEISELRTNFSNMEGNLKDLRAENRDLIEEKGQFELASEKALDNIVKDIMNNLYQSLVTTLEDNKSYSSVEILRICGGVIKQETNNAIKRKNFNN